MDFSGISVVDLTQGTLLGICILSIITGMWVPRRTYLDMVRDRDAEKLARQKSEAQNHDLMLASSKVAAAVLEALPRPKDAE